MDYPPDTTKEERRKELERQLAEARERQRQRDAADWDDSRERYRATEEREALMGEESGPQTPEEREIEQEIENLSPEERGKIKWGLSTIGFKAEKWKSDLLAKIFKKGVKTFGESGFVGKFCKEITEHYVANSKNAVKRASDPMAFKDANIGINIKGVKIGVDIAAKTQRRLANWGAFSGNVLKYGRLVADVFGLTVGATNRIVMAAGMATAPVAEPGKEDRLQT